MRKISQIEGVVVPIKHSNIDTDIIMPKQFLKSIKRTGYGDFVFDAWRYQDKGALGMDCSRRPLHKNFPLNMPVYQGAKILLTQRNFGCGSSREHAVWGLVEYGFEAVVASSFADIFYSNAIKNGLLPIALPEETIADLFAEIDANPGLKWHIDLPNQTLQTNQLQLPFTINAADKETLTHGLDAISMTLKKAAKIKQYESKRSKQEPWIFNKI